MKNISAFILILLVGFFSGCNKDSGKNNDATSVSNTLTSGTWRVTWFWNTGIDKTGDYTGYTFTFQSSGILNGVKGSSNSVGVWSAIDSNDGTENCDVVISFITQNPLANLSRKWHVIEESTTKLRMVDEGGSGGADYLTIEKN